MQKVSLIITVLNESLNIELLLSSILMQTIRPDEVVLVDGGSNDGTVRIIKEYLQIANSNQPKKIAGEGKNDFRIKNLEIIFKVFTKKGNRSVGRNFAIKKAQYEWIAITDSGCILRRNWLKELKKALLKKKPINSLLEKKLISPFKKTQQNQLEPGVVAGYYDADPVGALEAAMIPYVLVMPKRVDPDNFLPATRSMMIKKQVWQELGGFDEDLSDNEDYALARKMKQAGIKIIFAKKAVVTWIPHSNLRGFAWMIFRFARGDAKARLFRPKVALIFGRYFIFGLVLWINFLLGVAVFGFYLSWSIWKNYQYAARGWYYLPLFQVISDGAVMWGTLKGLV